MVAVGDLAGRRRDGLGDIGVQKPEGGVGLGGRELDEGQGPDEPPREARAGDREVEHRALRRGAVQRIDRDGYLAHGVALDAGLAARSVRHAPDCRRPGQRGRAHRRWTARAPKPAAA